MSQPTKQLAVRLPLDLHAQIVATAAENNRSGHAEMLHRLEASFNDPAPAGHTMVEAAELTEVFTTCFTKLEERVAAMLDHPMRHVYSVTIPDDASKEDIDALRTSLKARGAYAELSQLFGDVEYRRFESPGRPGAPSPTGRLSESQPELQDLPPVSGMSTLAASVRAMGCMCSGGYTGDPRLKEGEVPAILSPGREWRSYPFTTGAWPPVAEPGERPQPFTGKTWVITGSLETMTRDRAREIIMELGGTVAGSVDQKTHALVWGPGAGSKKTRAEQLGVQQYTERQFIELIRSLGVDMPLPKENEWLENPGYCPTMGATVLQVTLASGKVDTDYARNFDWRLESPAPLAIIKWRYPQ